MDYKDRVSVDVIIPVYKPDERFLGLIGALEGQSVKPDKILMINTGKEYFDALPDRGAALEAYDNTEILHITEEEFDHAGTRKMAASLCSSRYMIFMTMDAYPASDSLIEELIKPFESESDVAVTYARQLPAEGASPVEIYNRHFNYPDTDQKKTAKDVSRLGIKTYFCSDVCACYRRDIYEELGGHIEKASFNEDMIYAHDAMKAGYAVYYASSAMVYHSHDHTIGEQYRRNMEIGRSQAEHPEVFGGLSSEGEGWKLVKGCISYLMKEGYWYLIPYYILQCAARYLGYRKGMKQAGQGGKDVHDK